MLIRQATITIFLLSTILITTGFHTLILFAPSSAFRLPVMPGVTLTVTQGNNQGDHIATYGSEYAFDFAVKDQSNFVITAAQSGQVIGFNDSSITQCDQLNEESYPEQKHLDKCWAYANFVLIANGDGKTASLYVHLLPYSNGTTMPKVTCGEHVNQGDPIGLAGTTGYSFGIHVHFQVESHPTSISPSNCQQANPESGWWWTNSLPISFSNPEILAKDACLSIASNGVPQTGQCFVVSNPPISTPTSITTPSVPVPVPTPTQPLTPTPSRTLLYTADWSQGLNGWIGSSEWSTTHGELHSNGMEDGHPDTILSPFHPTIANYAVEARIQVVSLTNQCYVGIRGRAENNSLYQGYFGGYSSSGDGAEIDLITSVSPNSAFYNLKSQPYTLDLAWHIYRVEFIGNQITLKIDRKLIMQVTDNRSLAPGLVGLASGGIGGGCSIDVSSFQVFAL